MQRTLIKKHKDRWLDTGTPAHNDVKVMMRWSKRSTYHNWQKSEGKRISEVFCLD